MNILKGFDYELDVVGGHPVALVRVHFANVIMLAEDDGIAHDGVLPFTVSMPHCLAAMKAFAGLGAALGVAARHLADGAAPREALRAGEALLPDEPPAQPGPSGPPKPAGKKTKATRGKAKPKQA